jgi:hypothetical protein
MNLETLSPRWRAEPLVIVAATGPSLTPEIAEQCRGHRTIAVSDAYRLMPWADVLYSCDLKWWRLHDGCKAFQGERWSTHDSGNNDKREAVRLYGVRVVEGQPGDKFSTNPALIHYGNNSGFQAVNFAILSGARRIVMVGFDMKGRHFFGDHPKPLRNPSSYNSFMKAFATAATAMPAGVQIINATRGSALTCFPMMPLGAALDARAAA